MSGTKGWQGAQDPAIRALWSHGSSTIADMAAILETPTLTINGPGCSLCTGGWLDDDLDNGIVSRCHACNPVQVSTPAVTVPNDQHEGTTDRGHITNLRRRRDIDGD